MPAWTLMLYLAGADDLEPCMARAMLALERAGPPPDVEVIVQLARAPLSVQQAILPGREATGIDGDWHGVRRYRLRPRQEGAEVNRFASELLGDFSGTSLSDPRTLRAFVDFAQTNYPADRTMLVLSGHGMGFIGLALDLMTSPSPTLMSIRGLAAALRSARRQPDILLLDACQMNCLEIACELAVPRPAAGWMITPASLAPGNGLDYQAVLTALAEASSASSEATVTEIARALEPSARVQMLAFQLSPERWRQVALLARDAASAVHRPMFQQVAQTCVHPPPGARLRLLVHWPTALHFPERYHYLYHRLRFVRLSGWGRLLPASDRKALPGERLAPLLAPSPLLAAWLGQYRQGLTDPQMEQLLKMLGWANQ